MFGLLSSSCFINLLILRFMPQDLISLSCLYVEPFSSHNGACGLLFSHDRGAAFHSEVSSLAASGRRPPGNGSDQAPKRLS